MTIKHINAFHSLFHPFLFIITISTINPHLINYTETLTHLSPIRNKQFKGSWKLTTFTSLSSNTSFPNYFNELNNNNGDLFLFINFSSVNKRRPSLFIEIDLLDGIYKEKWIKLLTFRPFRYENQSYYFDMYINSSTINNEHTNSNKQYISLSNIYMNHSSYKLCKVIQYQKTKHMPIDNITITLEGDSHLDYVKGNVVSLLAGFNLTFNGVLLSQNEVIENKLAMKYFLFGLAIVGLIHFFTLISTIRKQRCKRDFQFRNFSPFLITNDMVLNCIIFICSISLSFEYNSQGEGLAVISFLYFFIFAFVEGILLYFRYNFENLSEMKKLCLTCFLAIISFIIIGNYLFICNLFIILLLFSSFIPQIIYNVTHFKEKSNSIPKKNLLGFILNKLYLPLYFKGYAGNVFKTKVNEMFVISYVVVLFCQIGIVIIQQKYGGDVIIPKKCRKGYYKYTKNVRDVAKEYKEFYTSNQCSICLCPFVENMEVLRSSIKSRNMVRMVKERIFDKQVYIMVTPCRHFFHCECLRSWIQMKMICPICRKKIPKMSYD